MCRRGGNIVVCWKISWIVDWCVRFVWLWFFIGSDRVGLNGFISRGRYWSVFVLWVFKKILWKRCVGYLCFRFLIKSRCILWMRVFSFRRNIYCNGRWFLWNKRFCYNGDWWVVVFIWCYVFMWFNFDVKSIRK